MKGAMEALRTEFASLRTGRASASMVPHSGVGGCAPMPQASARSIGRVTGRITGRIMGRIMGRVSPPLSSGAL